MFCVCYIGKSQQTNTSNASFILKRDFLINSLLIVEIWKKKTCLKFRWSNNSNSGREGTGPQRAQTVILGKRLQTIKRNGTWNRSSSLFMDLVLVILTIGGSETEETPIYEGNFKVSLLFRLVICSFKFPLSDTPLKAKETC